MCLYFHFFTGGFCPGVYTILGVAAPRTDVHASGGTCFFRQVWYECLGIEWGVCTGLYCFLSLTVGVGPGVRSILAMAAPWADILAIGGDCFICWGRSECLGVDWVFVWASVSSRGE